MGHDEKIAVSSIAVGFGVLVAVCCIGSAFIGAVFPLDFLFALIAGWSFYLVRVVPQITWN